MRLSSLSAVPVLSVILTCFSGAGILLDTVYAGRPDVEAAFCRVHVCATRQLIDRARARLLELNDSNAQLAAREWREAVRRDPADAYRWCEAGQALLRANDPRAARLAFERAVELAPDIPPVLWQAAAFHLGARDPAAGLPVAARILALIRDYDPLVFLLYDRSGLPTAELLRAGIPPDKAAAQAFFVHTLQGDTPEAPREVWRWLEARRLLDDPVAARYLDYLLRQRLYAEAAARWTAFVAGRGGDYPQPNRIFNGGFESGFSGAPLDWTPASVEHVQEARDETTARTGKASLRITFDGTSNVAYPGISQSVILTPGAYTFRVWIKLQDLTTNRGIVVRIFDPESPARLDVRTEEKTGSSDWTPLEADFVIPHDEIRLLKVQLLREASTKFDNKIAGVAWLDQAEIVPRR